MGKSQFLEYSETQALKSLLFPFWRSVWTSAGHCDHFYKPNADWLIRRLHEQAVEYEQLIKFPEFMIAAAAY